MPSARDVETWFALMSWRSTGCKAPAAAPDADLHRALPRDRLLDAPEDLAGRDQSGIIAKEIRVVRRIDFELHIPVRLRKPTGVGQGRRPGSFDGSVPPPHRSDGPETIPAALPIRKARSFSFLMDQRVRSKRGVNGP